MVVVALGLVVSTSCGGRSNSEEFVQLQAELDELKGQGAATAPARTATAKTEQISSAWPDDYQTFWVDICTMILATSAAQEGYSAPDLCRCGLDGLMKTFPFKQYESWPQDVKDAAAVPFFHMCWPSG